MSRKRHERRLGLLGRMVIDGRLDALVWRAFHTAIARTVVQMIGGKWTVDERNAAVEQLTTAPS